MAGRLTAVNASVKENKTIHNIYVIVKIFGVHDENVFSISDVETAWLAAVEMLTPRIVRTECIVTRGSFWEGIEPFLQ